MNDERPSVASGDEVFYNHPTKGLSSGRVMGLPGVHGFHVADEGGLLGVKYEDYVGHKARAKRSLTLIEHGEDGYIAHDEHGQRVFVQGQLPEEQPLAKAHSMGQPEIDLALMRAGFVPELEYIQKSYGAHWRLPPAPTLLVDELRAQVLEVSRSTAEVAASLLEAVRELGHKSGEQ